MMWHFIWVFTVCQNTHLGVSGLQRVKAHNKPTSSDKGGVRSSSSSTLDLPAGKNNLYEMGLAARKPSLGVCEQQRWRPACASAQADQHLCYSHFGKYLL